MAHSRGARPSRAGLVVAPACGSGAGVHLLRGWGWLGRGLGARRLHLARHAPRGVPVRPRLCYGLVLGPGLGLGHLTMVLRCCFLGKNLAWLVAGASGDGVFGRHAPP